MHHSARGSQYLSIRHTERLAEAGVEASIGSRGDSYDNALAETINGFYKTEVIRRRSTLTLDPFDPRSLVLAIHGLSAPAHRHHGRQGLGSALDVA